MSSTAAQNIFTEGMMKDLHPLTTPNKVLTDCLNGTYITYNGNEYMLQNDMGNIIVGHDGVKNKLPAGYIPVGMAEYGGIIYVAAYNPTTKKGQVGSFPSPQLIFVSSKAGANDPVSVDKFFKGTKDGEEYLIVTTSLTIPILYDKDENGQKTDQIKLYPGDKFQIVGSPKYTKYLTYTLYAKNDGGQLEELLNLRTFTQTIDGESVTTFFQPEADTNYENHDKYLIFNCKNAGVLVLGIKFNTFSGFEVQRKYSEELSEEGEKTGNIQVKFLYNLTIDEDATPIISELPSIWTTSDGYLPFTPSSTTTEVAKYVNTDSYKTFSITPGINGDSTPVTFQLFPGLADLTSGQSPSYIGYIKNLGKTVTLNYDTMRSSTDLISEFRYMVEDGNLRLNFGYDYYCLDEDKEILYLKLNFYSIESYSLLENGTYSKPDSPDLSLMIIKEYYSGNFEEIIPLSTEGEDGSLDPATIYVVEILRLSAGDTDETLIHPYFVYPTTLYNKYYGAYLMFDKLVEDNKVPAYTVTLGLTESQTITNTKTSYKYYYGKKPDEGDATSFTLGSSGMYVEISDPDSKDVYQFKVDRYDNYKVVATFGTSENITSVDGVTSKKLITNVKYKTTNNGTTTYEDITPHNIIPTTLGVGQTTYTWNPQGISSTISTSSGNTRLSGTVECMEQVFYDGIKSNNTTYYNNMATWRFSGDVHNGGILSNVLGGDEDNIKYASITIGTGDTTESSNAGGPEQQGLNDAMVNLGRKTFSFLGGDWGDHSSLRLNGKSHCAATEGANDEIADEASFIMLVMKHSNGNWYLTNIASSNHNEGAYYLTSDKINAVVQFRYLFGQMAVIKPRSKTGYFILPSVENVKDTTLTASNLSTQVVIDDDNLTSNVTICYKDADYDSLLAVCQGYYGDDVLINYLPSGEITIDNNCIGESNGDDETTRILNADIEVQDWTTDSVVSEAFASTAELKSPIEQELKDGTYERGKVYRLTDFTVSSEGWITPTANCQYTTDGSFNFDKLYSVSGVTMVKQTGILSSPSNYTTQYALDYGESADAQMSDDYYNGVLIKDGAISGSTWTKKGDGDGPDFVSAVAATYYPMMTV